jgi:hypothetical protein
MEYIDLENLWNMHMKQHQYHSSLGNLKKRIIILGLGPFLMMVSCDNHNSLQQICHHAISSYAIHDLPIPIMSKELRALSTMLVRITQKQKFHNKMSKSLEI